MRDEALKETFLSSQEIYRGAIIQVEKWQVSLPNGGTAIREIVKHKGAAAIVPVDDKGYVTMVRQHRIAVDKFTWEIPAGKLDSLLEDPFDAAKRELEEETGLQAQHWHLLNRIVTTPGFCSERIAIYVATGLSQHPSHPDPDEFLQLKRLPLDEAVAQCMAGEINDSKTVIGLLMAQRYLHDQAVPSFDAASAIQRMSGAASSLCGGK